ncbi:hypothetical protein JYU34_004489 [Plutella xylostella]|uniref:Peroxidase n=1 Tax=Plutella xylostella TaxID=51655 RepID=A0ABQ7QY46_PLUXY|nr:hypothetical protein JYU34_004489 [Plutella xylostella]
MYYLLYISAVINWFGVDGATYHRYTGRELNETQIALLKTQNLTTQCTIELKPCTPHEGSRVDGTCNNLKHPARGSATGPYLRLLKPDYGKNGTIRTSSSGKPLPSARRVRTSIQSTGRVVDKITFNMAAVHLAGFLAIDTSAVNGILDYIKVRQDCCQPEGLKDPRCIPIDVPEDDPYLKVTNIRCLNFSRAETFQDMGCAPKTLDPEQVNHQTPVLDLSGVYGITEEALSSVREGRDGLLKMEVRNGRYVPLGDAGQDTCFRNQGNETTCYRFGNPTIGNFDLRLATFTIFFMREHNRIAKTLKKINSCWKDDRLFKVARQINVATAANLFMYEVLPIIMGYKHMVNYGLLSPRVEHITAYDEDAVPLLYAEYVIAARYFHTFIDGRIKMYDEKYHYSGDLSISSTLFRLALIEEGDNFEAINRGTFYQQSAKMDDIQDPEISENFYGGIQRAHDLPAMDLQRGRDLGLRGYNDYRQLCGMRPAASFEDFRDVMDVEKVDALKNLYENVSDVDLMAGIMSESFIRDTFVGPTLFCIMAKQLRLMRFADRFWFERGGQPHSLTLDQLAEIRKTNTARLACDNAEGIKYMQPHALLNVGPGNEPVPCTHVAGPDLTKWRDDSCHRQKQSVANSNPFAYSFT